MAGKSQHSAAAVCRCIYLQSCLATIKVVYRAVEKRRPTYDLAAVRTVLGAVETLAITTSAFRDAIGLGFDRAGIAEVIQGMNRKMFFKSMTTIRDHRVWQDVYHVPARGLVLYVKFQADVVTEFTVMSFKEK
ncbi:type II toxin-antitoxin system MqsR family toxin [Acidocella aquatica]|uniref:type II toxin-antitoxin system MqsR family toxin n=1 Tax=Acidocella aquatica TaxID=1922313 RepID=UPI0024E11723|nr:type II toxin-antitoxin system MqsR family toxin [Acidocella aquatica]